MSDFFHDFWACIDASDALATLDQVEGRRKQVDLNLENTDKKSKLTFEKARHIAMGAWNMLTSVLEIAGVSISATTRAVATGIINVSLMLYQLATAEAMTPALWWKVGLTISQAEIAAIMATQTQQSGVAMAQEINSLLGNIRSFAGGFYF